MKFTWNMAISVLLLMATLGAFGQVQEPKPSIIPIREAIDKGILELSITGVFDPNSHHEVVDNDGLHFGKCMAIILQSKIDSLILLKLESGTELIPHDSTYQTMIVTKTVELPLYPNQTYLTRFYAMCGQLHDAPPSFGIYYVVGELSDSNTVKLAKYFEANFIQNMIGQHALWAYTDNAEFEELQKYGADSLSIALTTNILDYLSIQTALNKKEPATQPDQQAELEPDNTTIAVSKTLVFAAGGIIIILLITSILLLVRRPKKEERNS